LARNRLAKDIVTTTLRIFVGESWPMQPATRWVLLSDRGDAQREGESDALHWPAADCCEAVISALQVTWLRADIPQRISRRDLMAVVAGTLEDRLLEDLDQCHLTLCGRQRGRADVLVISRSRLRNVVAQFAALGRPLSAAYSELQTRVDEQPGGTLAVVSGAVIVHLPTHTATAVDLSADGTPPATLAALVGTGDSAGGIGIAFEPGQTPHLAPWQAALGVSALRRGQDYRWYEVAADAANLLHGEFVAAGRRDEAWRLVKPAAMVAAVVLGVQVAVAVFQVGWQRYNLYRAQSQMVELFRSSFPSVPRVEPVMQTRRQLDRLRAAQGMLGSDDVLTLLSVIADVLGVEGADSVRELKYENRQLSVVLLPRLAGRIEDWRRQFAARGYGAVVRAAADGAPMLVVQQEVVR
jgi:type II secretion system protein L